MSQRTLFDLSTTELLERFGAGKATPGSGCAAALMALLSAKLITAVARMTVQSPSTDEGVRDQAKLVVRVLETRIGPRLVELFNLDASVFEEVIRIRKLRDKATDPGDARRYTAQASEKLHEATEILFEIVDLSFQVKDYGIAIWERGFRPAMGDAGAGISSAIAAITTCLLVSNLNLRSARSNWAREAKLRCDEISARLYAAQDQLLHLVRTSNDATTVRIAAPTFGEPTLLPRKESHRRDQR